MQNDELLDKRARAVEMLSAGSSCAEVARQLAIAPQTAYSWRKIYLNEGGVALHIRPLRGGRSRLAPEVRAELRKLFQPESSRLSQDRKWTKVTFQAYLRDACGVTYSQTHAWRLLQAFQVE